MQATKIEAEAEGGVTPWSWGDGVDPDTVSLIITLTGGPQDVAYPLTVAIESDGVKYTFFDGGGVKAGSYTAEATLKVGPRENGSMSVRMSTSSAFIVIID